MAISTTTNRQSKKIRLRTVLIVPFVLQVVTAVGLVGWLSFRSGQRAVNDLASQLQQEVAVRVQTEVRQYLAFPHLLHQVNLQVLQQNLLAPDNFDALERYFWAQSQVFESLGTLAFANEEGEFVGANGLEDYVVRATVDTGRVLRRYGVDAQGNRTQLLREKADYDARKRGWYQQGRTVTEPMWTEIEPSAIGQRLDSSVVYPVYDSQNQFQGVLLADVPLFGISEILKAVQVGKTGQTFIIDRDGLLVASSTADTYGIIRTNGDREPQRLRAESSQNPAIRATVEALEGRFPQWEMMNQAQQLRLQVGEQRIFVQILPFTDAYGLDWLIVIVLPEADFMTEIYQNLRTTIVLTLLALVGAIAISIFTTYYLVRPLERITLASAQLADGQLQQQPGSPIQELHTLAHSFNRMAAHLKQILTTLEDKVTERTAQLAQANQHISTLNEKLQHENLRMAAELDVAHQLQAMILPKSGEIAQIKDLDIFGFSEPADEVAGDYYDIIPIGNQTQIGIGDVTGHGLESGVLMIMTQTAVRTLCASPLADFSQSLSAINQVIHENRQRMGSQRSLSLSFLNYCGGKIKVTGQHEEVIVVRQDTRIERIDTTDLGFPIGMIADISDFISQVEIELEPGDGVVLYTDGITEAENKHREFYGLARLLTVIQKNWHHCAQEIGKAIVEDVKTHIGEHKIYDDITLVVLKRLQ